jgi:hypothetical protein
LRTGACQLRALRQTQKIVRRVFVSLRLDVLVPKPAFGNDYINPVIVVLDVEGPLPRLDACYSVLLGDLPPRIVAIKAANVGDALVGIVSFFFVDAKNSVTRCHASYLLGCIGEGSIRLSLGT